MELTPQQIVLELDKYIVGQGEAKKKVAIALRNRIRRSRLHENLRDEVAPKNILMIGSTGVGKTEIARRLAKLADAPFVKVEATRFTEVGYVGRDVESMVRDLVETSIRMVKQEQMERVTEQAKERVEERLVRLLEPGEKKESNARNPFEAFFSQTKEEEKPDDNLLRRRRIAQKQLAMGELEDVLIDVDVEDAMPMPDFLKMSPGMDEMGANLQEFLGNMAPKKKHKKRLSVREARRVLLLEEAQKLVDSDQVHSEALRRAEQAGIIFIDEIDKVASHQSGQGPDVSREGVQRDILPIVEGTTIQTKYGSLKTDYILFIAAGAFHLSKPSDLIPELQGRFPIRVELESLKENDFRRILVEPRNALIRQYAELLATDGVTLEFTDEAIHEIARVAAVVNREMENIGARRLHTLLEQVLSELSFAAPDQAQGQVTITKEYVTERVASLMQNQDLARYIL